MSLWDTHGETSVVVIRPSVYNFKRLLRNRLANRSQISRGASLERGTKVYINGSGHMTKMAAMQFMVKTFKNSSPEPKEIGM